MPQPHDRELVGTGEDPPGQAVYTPFFLNWVYDPLVVRFANRFTWRCPSRTILDLYNQNVSRDHLDVGPGSGWYLAHCHFPGGSPRLTLMDLNVNALAVASRRLRRYAPTSHKVDVLAPIDLDSRTYGSIGLTHVLHCLPGTMIEKGAAFTHLAPLLRPGGRIFGSTILDAGVDHNRLARDQLTRMNDTGVFSNRTDSAVALAAALEPSFTATVWTVGSVALFTGVVRTPDSTMVESGRLVKFD